MRRYVLALDAATDLGRILRDLRTQAGEEVAGQVGLVIRNGLVLLAENPGVGHFRRDLTGKPVKFFPVQSWMIVYRPDTRPLQVVSILHSSRDVANILRERIN